MKVNDTVKVIGLENKPNEYPIHYFPIGTIGKVLQVKNKMIQVQNQKGLIQYIHIDELDVIKSKGQQCTAYEETISDDFPSNVIEVADPTTIIAWEQDAHN